MKWVVFLYLTRFNCKTMANVSILCLMILFILEHDAFGQGNLDAADAFFDRGNKLYKNHDFIGAEKSWLKALPIYFNLRLDEKIAYTLSSLGVVSLTLGKYGKAIEYFEEALRIFHELRLEGNVANTLRNLGAVTGELDKHKKAMEYYVEALKIFRNLRLEEEVASTLHNMGKSVCTLGEYEKAVGYFVEALTINRKLKFLLQKPELEKAIADTLVGLGVVAVEMGEFGKAIEGYEEALNIYYKLGLTETMEMAEVINNLGMVADNLGEYGKAIGYYQDALKIKFRLGLRKEVATTLLNIGVSLSIIGEYEKAISYYEDALKIFRGLRLQREEAYVLCNLGTVAKNFGEYKKSEKHYLDALKIFNRLALKKEELATQNNLGLLYLDMGQIGEALNIFLRYGSNLHLGIGYLAVGKAGEAKQYLEMAVNSAINAEFLVASLISLAQCYEKMEKYVVALEYYEAAVKAIEDQRETVPQSQKRMFLDTKVYSARRIEAYEGLVRVLHKTNMDENGFYWSENTKARTFIESIANAPYGITFGIPSPIRNHEKALINRIAAMKRRIDRAFQKDNKQLYSQLETELNKLKQEQQVLISNIRQEYPEYASMQYPQPLKASELALHPDEVLVEFEVTEPETIVFVVRGGRVVHAYSVGMTRKELQQKVERFRQCMKTIVSSECRLGWSDFDVALAHSLYRSLLEPALKHVKGKEKLLIVPDEMLCLLPFEALVEAMPEGELGWCGGENDKGLYPKGVLYVGDNRVISYWQSGSALTVTRHLRKGVGKQRMLVVADPVYREIELTERQAEGEKAQWKPEGKLVAMAMRGEDLSMRMKILTDEQGSVKDYLNWPNVSRLPETKYFFADSLKRKYGGAVKALLGAEACESRLLIEPTEEYGFAVLFALHGIVDERTPYLQQATLLLSNPLVIGEPPKVKVGENGSEREIDGRLTMSEVMELKMPTELAGALACRTGEGEIVAGEGVMNLGRAFQYAGARSALVSLWEVYGESTNLLTEQMMDGMWSGRPKDEALLKARKRLRQEGYEHPFYWAPFILIGERDMVISKGNGKGKLLILLAGSAVILVVVAIWVVKRQQ